MLQSPGSRGRTIKDLSLRQAPSRDESRSPSYQALARRGAFLGVILAVLVIVIIFLMVVKPELWA